MAQHLCHKCSGWTRDTVVVLVLMISLFVSCTTTEGPRSEPASGAEAPSAEATAVTPVILGEQTSGPGEMAVGRHGGTLRLELLEPPTTFNPAMDTGFSGDSQVLPMVFSRVVDLIDKYPDSREGGANLAESYRFADDSRSVEVVLREGLQWSDGAPLTVDDIVYSYTKLFFNPDVGGIGAEMAQRLGGITVTGTGERSFRITAGLANNEFRDVFQFQPMPRHIVEPWLQDREPAEFFDFWASYGDLSNHVGSGPFSLVSYQEAEEFAVGDGIYELAVVELKRNPYYHRTDSAGQQLPYLDGLTLLGRDETTDTPDALYWSGLIDIAELPIGSPDGTEYGSSHAMTRALAAQAAQAIPGGHYVVTDTSTYTGTFLAFNMQRSPGPDGGGLEPPMSEWFNDLRFRQAISHLIPRARIVTDMHDGDAVPTYGHLAPGAPGYSQEMERLIPHYDPEAADALLTEMGLVDRDGDGIRETANRTPVAFTLVTNSPNAYRAALVGVLAQAFRSGGLDVTAEPLEWDPLLERVFEAKYHAVVLGLQGSPSLLTGLNIWGSDGNLHLWDLNQPTPVRDWESRLDEIILEYEIITGDLPLAEKEREIQRILAEHLPLLRITRGYDYLLIRRPIGNVRLVADHRSYLPVEYLFLSD